MIRPPKFGRSWWDRGCDCLVTQEVWRGSECLEYQKSSSMTDDPFFIHYKSVNFSLSNCQGLGDFSHERHLQAIGGKGSLSFIWEGLDVIPERKLCRASHKNSPGLTFSQLILICNILDPHRTASSEHGCSLSKKKQERKKFSPTILKVNQVN